MAPLLGVLAGAGLFLIWWSAWEGPAARQAPSADRAACEDLLALRRH